MDTKTKQVLYEQKAYETAYPASLTKLMTLLLTFEAIDSGELSLTAETRISQNAAGMGGTQLYLEEGEVRTIEELIYATLIESANDAATALAEAVGTSFENFIAMMNLRAKELNLKNTVFVNACGLDEDGHYTCAYDVAVIACELTKYEEIFKYSTTWMKDVYVGKNNDVLRTLVNTNKLIARNDSVDGLKTGFTEKAGCCICVTSQKNGLRLVGVIMNAPSSDVRFSEGEEIINYGFANYEAKILCESGGIVCDAKIINSENDTVPLSVKQDKYFLYKTSDNVEITEEINLTSEMFYAPIEKDTVVGEVIYSVNETEYFRTKLYTAESASKINLISYIKKISDMLFPF